MYNNDSEALDLISYETGGLSQFGSHVMRTSDSK